MLSVTINISGRAVAGAALIGIAVAISSLGIVRAEREGIRPDTKVFSCTSGKACIEGNATGKNIEGVFGNSASGTGVQGNSTATNSNSGVAGVNTATTGTGYGVYGRSSNGPGVYGTSSDTGVYGTSSNIGVYGAGSGDGVVGEATLAGVVGANDSGGTAIEAIGGTTGTDLFDSFDTTNLAGCTIDGSANLTCTGTIQGGTEMSFRHKTSEGRQVLAYAAQAASATIEDVGTARMWSGVANVQIDPAFASVIDHKWYYVFLTPLGDTRGLYVSMKTASAFQVRETERGRSNLEFDYRIVAHPLGAKDDRLPPTPAMPRHRLPQQMH